MRRLEWGAFRFIADRYKPEEQNAMPTARKEAAVGELAEKLAGAKNLFLTDYAGLTVAEITGLRGELRKDGNTYSVVKNTLFRSLPAISLASLESFLAGPTGIVFAGADPVAPAKALKTFSDTVKRIAVKAAYIDGKDRRREASRDSSRSFRPRSNSLQISSARSPIRFAGSLPCSRGIRAASCACSMRIREQKAGATSNA